MMPDGVAPRDGAGCRSLSVRAACLWLFLVGGGVLLVDSNAPAAEPTLRRYEFTEPQMGVPFKIVVYAEQQSLANQSSQAAFRRISELNAILSDYEESSELSRLSRGSPHAQPVPVSADLFRVLTISQQLAGRTDGAFDVTVGPLVQLWRRARRQHALPTPERLATARAAVDYRALKLVPDTQSVQLTKARMRLDLGGIGMGYAVDAALDVIKKHGIGSAMIDASGDIGTLQAPPGQSGWRIGISPDNVPGSAIRFVSLANKAFALSGDAYQHVDIDGVRYSHIVDPKTGLGLTDRSAVAVIADDCTTADSFATAISVLGPKKGLKLASDTPGVEATIVRVINDKPERVESDGFRQFDARD